MPGAVAGALGWTGLHAVGGLYIDHVVREASLTYGAFAVVIGLLSWLYLQTRLLLLAAELNTVLADRLWPRSLVSDGSAASPAREDGGWTRQRTSVPSAVRGTHLSHAAAPRLERAWPDRDSSGTARGR